VRENIPGWLKFAQPVPLLTVPMTNARVSPSASVYHRKRGPPLSPEAIARD
jgi:hypothetical protein